MFDQAVPRLRGRLVMTTAVLALSCLEGFLEWGYTNSWMVYNGKF